MASPKTAKISSQRFISRANHKVATQLVNDNSPLYSDVSHVISSNNNQSINDKSPKSQSNSYIVPVMQANSKQQQEIKASPPCTIKFSTFQNANHSNNINNSNSNLYSTTVTCNLNNENFTNKLPPVPKRTGGTQTSVNNSHNLINLNQKLNIKNTDINSTAKYAIINSALNNNNNNKTMFTQSLDAPHLRPGSYDTMNYKMMAKQQNNQNKNSYNSGYATYRSLNSNKRNLLPQSYEENRNVSKLNTKNEHDI